MAQHRNLAERITDPGNEAILSLYVLAASATLAAFASILPSIRNLFATWHLLNTVLHEACHAAVLIVMGGSRVDVMIERRGNGSTDGISRQFRPQETLQKSLSRTQIRLIFLAPAGHLGAGFLGAAILGCGFDILTSKIAALVLVAILAFSFIVVKKDRIDVPVILGHILMPWPLWFVQHGKALRICNLWIGAWVVVDNIRTLKQNAKVATSGAGHLDVGQFSRITGGSHVAHAMVWTLLSILMVVAAIFGGLLLNDDDFSGQIRRASLFLPT